MSPPLEPQWAPWQQIQSGSSRSEVEGSVNRLSCAPGSKLQGAIEMVLNTGQHCPSSINTNTKKKTKNNNNNKKTQSPSQCHQSSSVDPLQQSDPGESAQVAKGDGEAT